jgi:hypothetical protein
MVLADTPLFPHRVPACLKDHLANMGKCEVPRSVGLQLSHDRLESSVAAANGATFASMNPWVCPYELCPVIVGHLLLWRDSNHLTTTYSRQLAPALGALVAKALAGPSPAGANALATSTVTGQLQPTSTDSDGDGLSNAFEKKYGLDPNSPDSDGDGLLDPAEDPDGDGLSNLGEQRFGTSPLDADTNHDGVSDSREDSNHDGVPDGKEQDHRPVPAHLKPSLKNAYNDTPPSYRDGCHSGVYETTIHPCVYGDRNGSRTVALFGDSHAAQWLPALIAIANAEHWKIRSLTKSGCPSVTVHFKEGTYAGAEKSCRTWRKRALAWLASHPPDLIVVTNYRSYQLLDASGHTLSGAARQQAWGSGLSKTLDALPGSSRLLVLGDTPQMSSDPPACLQQHSANIAACETSRSAAMSPAHDQAERAAATGAGASFASLSAQVCPYDPCPLVVGHFMMWREQTHLTATYARQLAPSLRALLTPLMP